MNIGESLLDINKAVTPKACEECVLHDFSKSKVCACSEGHGEMVLADL